MPRLAQAIAFDMKLQANFFRHTNCNSVGRAGTAVVVGLLCVSAASVSLVSAEPSRTLGEAPARNSSVSGNAGWRTMGTDPSVEAVRAAGEQFNLGRTAFKSNEYATAAEHFERADALAPNPQVLLLAIQARDHAGMFARAATLAALASNRYPGDARFGEAKGLIQHATAELSTLRVRCDSPCNVLVGSRLLHGHPALERDVFLSPGEYRVRVVWADERDASADYVAIAAQVGALVFRMPPERQAPTLEVNTSPSAAQVPQPWASSARNEVSADKGESTGLPPAVFWSGVAVTGILTGLSIWSALDTVDSPGSAEVRAACEGQGDSCALFQEGRAKQTRTNILWAATAGVGLGTAVVGGWLTDWIGPGPSPIAVTPWIGVGTGAVVGASGRF